MCYCSLFRFFGIVGLIIVLDLFVEGNVYGGLFGVVKYFF